MYTSASVRRKIVLTCFWGIAFSLTFIAYYLSQYSDSPLPAANISISVKEEKNKPVILSIGSPVRITIPSIDVDAVLEYVGLTPEGEMGNPTEIDNAAWLNRLPLPGEVGTSVIAGHFGFKDHKPAVFNNLHKLRKGDKLYVEDSKGVVTTFVVRKLRTYLPEQDAAEVFGSSDGKSHLNLITCEGTWVESLKSYDNRLVVFAEKTEL